jgi:predicted MFS family arabinose efflux permease
MPNPITRRELIVLLLARLALNLQARIVYPFLPAMSRGLGVPLETGSLLLTVRALVAGLSPLYGLAADRYGRRPVMLAGLISLVAGSAVVALAPGLGIALAAFALLGFSKAAFDPAMQAYVGDAAPYNSRGRIMSLLELAWSLSWFVGVPVAGFLIAAAGWRAPFAAIAAVGALALVALWRMCPRCGAATNGLVRPALLAGFRLVPWSRCLPFLALTTCITLANENVFIVYGAWLENQFGLAVAAVGLASLVISVAELVAELASAGWVDRLGKRRAVLIGLFLSVVAYLALPLLADNLPGGLAGITLMFLTFEFSIVASIPLISEIAPEARGTVMALNVAAASLGRMVGSLSGPRLWNGYGLAGVALASAAFALIACLILSANHEPGNAGQGR